MIVGDLQYFGCATTGEFSAHQHIMSSSHLSGYFEKAVKFTGVKSNATDDNKYVLQQSLVGDLIVLCKTVVPMPDPKTEFRGDIQVHAAEHAALLYASHTWK